MHRVRDANCPVHLFAYKSRNGNKSINDLFDEKIDRISAAFSEIHKIQYKYRTTEDRGFLQGAIVSFQSAIDDYKNSPFTKYLDELKEARLLGQHSYRDLLVHDLRMRGYDVNDADEVEVDNEKVSTAKQSEAIKQEKSLAILNAKILNDDEYESVNRREVKTPEQVAEARKYIFLKQFPDINKLDDWDVDLIKELIFDNPESKSKLWRRYLLENEDLNTLIRDKKVIGSIIHGFSLDDWDVLHSVVMELKEISYILTPLMNSKAINSESSLVKAFVYALEKCKYLPKQGKLGNIQYLNKILELIGYKANYKGQKRDENGNRRREYVIADNLYYEVGEGKEKRKIMLQPLLQECLDRRKEGLFEKYNNEYFEEQKKKFLGEETTETEKKPALFTREFLSDEEYMENVQYSEDLETHENQQIDVTPMLPNENVDDDKTPKIIPEVGANRVKQVVSYFFNGIKSGATTLDQIASSIECFGREVFEQACYANSLLLARCIDADYNFMEA
ncbi:hypothetical protein, partial [Dapis sp. BLCC M172]|uniref:hypothetical protein n=1 Tax=Dapis sp. BLCC M172 TaxID=2975281 RepID=UPI003CF9A280